MRSIQELAAELTAATSHGEVSPDALVIAVAIVRSAELVAESLGSLAEGANGHAGGLEAVALAIAGQLTVRKADGQ